jgi:hypothetical protein
MERERIRKIIVTALNMKLNVHGDFMEPAKIPTAKNILGKEREIKNHLFKHSSLAHDYYEFVLGWIEGNPSKLNLTKAIEDAYIFCQEVGGADPSNLVNTAVGHNEFYALITECNPSTIFLVAPRGAGKTFYLNYLINTKSSDLLDDKVIWFRADATKIYKKNRELYEVIANLPDKEELYISLLDYLYIQVIYVSFKYRKTNHILNEFWNPANNDALKSLIKFCSIYGKFSQPVEQSLIIDNFKEFIKKLALLEDKARVHVADDTKKTPISSGLKKQNVEEVLKLESNFISSKIYFYAILDFLAIKEYKVCFFIDGLDNIDFHRYIHFYNKLVSDVSSLCLSQDKLNLLNSMFVLSLRDETFEHLKSFNPIFFGKKPIVFRIKEMVPSDILKGKVNMAVDPGSEYHSTNKEQTAFRIQDFLNKFPDKKYKLTTIADFDKVFQKFATHFINNILTALRLKTPEQSQILKRAFENETTFFQYMYNWNLRDFIHNFLNIFIYYVLFHDKQQHIKEHRDYVLAEGQLLNGFLYLDTIEAEMSNELGNCIPNMFWFDKNFSHGTWHGLCQYRILQLLKWKISKEKEWIISYMLNNFNYSNEIISHRFFSAITNGLIYCEYNPNIRSRKYSLTEKGKLFLEFPFYDIDRFYYFALDTPFISDVLDNTNLTSFHINNGDGYWIQFIESSIITSITLIRHVLSQHKIEKDSHIEDFDKIFHLPSIFPSLIIDDMLIKLDYLRRIEEQRKTSIRYSQLVSTIQGL